MNELTIAFKKLNQHVDAAVSEIQDPEQLKAELMKLTKEKLVERIMEGIKTQSVKIEDVAKAILEDDECKYLTYEQIATVICKKIPRAKTSAKSLASYASKYPTQKGWKVVKRESQQKLLAQLMTEAVSEKGE